MGLLSKFKKPFKKVLSLAVKTAPIWSNFIPVGGSAIGRVVEKVGGAYQKAKQFRNKLPPRMRVMLAKGIKPPGFDEGSLAMGAAAEMSDREEMMYSSQGVGHAGIRGPVPLHWGPKHKMAGVLPFRSTHAAGGTRRRRTTAARRARPRARTLRRRPVRRMARRRAPMRRRRYA